MSKKRNKLIVTVLLIALAFAAGGCPKQRPVEKSLSLDSPCPDIKNLLSYPYDRIGPDEPIDVLNELEREVCLIDWVKKGLKLPIVQ